MAALLSISTNELLLCEVLSEIIVFMHTNVVIMSVMPEIMNRTCVINKA